MAAVLCLVCLPTVAALGFMTGALRGDLSLSSVLGGLTFLVLAAGIIVGSVNMARGWDEEDLDHH